tara:strand:+ start:4716 stop:5261 length:546 start_codon:yes stop_codon:yes gene_type:complete
MCKIISIFLAQFFLIVGVWSMGVFIEHFKSIDIILNQQPRLWMTLIFVISFYLALAPIVFMFGGFSDLKSILTPEPGSLEGIEFFFFFLGLIFQLFSFILYKHSSIKQKKSLATYKILILFFIINNTLYWIILRFFPVLESIIISTTIGSIIFSLKFLDKKNQDEDVMKFIKKNYRPPKYK